MISKTDDLNRPEGKQPGPNLTARSTPPIVTTNWLEQEKDSSNLIIVDIREPKDFNTGHIPGSVNIPMPVFAVNRNGLLLMLPDKERIFRRVGDAGVRRSSTIIIVNVVNHFYPLANAARAAFTFIYAGVRNTSVLSGGIEKWKKEGKSITADSAKPEPVKYTSEVYPGMLVDKVYVEKRIGKTSIVDSRDPHIYFGVDVEPFASRPGHIPTASNLPVPWFWTEEGVYKEKTVLKKMVEGVIGRDTSKEIILYCGVGGYGATAWFVMHDLLGYENSKLYDGSAQEWAADPDAPLSIFQWE